ncbi:MAG: hypothetical protein RR444_07205, partial [Oscillospiraceae bacterium]
MKNKILASLLAVCLFVGLAVPAFALSSQSGIDGDIKTIDFSAKSFSVENGKGKNIADELQAFASTKQLVQDPSIEWS